MNFGAGPSSSSTSRGPGGPTNNAPVTVPLSIDLLNKFRPSKHFKDALDPESSTSTPTSFLDQQSQAGGLKNITSLSFDDTGDRLVTAGNDDMFVLWDCKKGKKIKPLYSRKYGIDLPRFTHKTGTIVHASTKGDDHAVRYHSMHDNKYLAYYKGHTARVRSVDMNPLDDTFITAGDDGTVRLWDLRASGCKGLVKDVGGSAIAAMDNQGIVFAVACSDTQTVMMYATSTMDRIPFSFVPLNDINFARDSIPPPKPIFTSIQFSSNGEYLLIGTSSDVHYLLDAIDLVPLRRLVGHQGLERDKTGNRGHVPRRGSSGEEISFTSDSKFVVGGSADGNILFWDLSNAQGGQDKLTRVELENGQKEAKSIPWHTMPIPDLQAKIILRGSTGTGMSRAVKFNPRLQMFAVGGEDLTFWIPEKDEDAKIQEGW
ncbi:compass component swd2 [Kwoniella mangroviensis CBS 10435]|uniref:Compass component swd2 n=1 Tax=Kwoniella mangroviensis CBS 10435 TaxID=1331196 RepID=A0A1B9IN06_9TREE|nr:compass component swd2 [Kwoniella mangroviensis CBS 10435]